MCAIQSILVFALIISSAGGGPREDQKPVPKVAGVVIDLRGPPKGSNFKLDYLITLEGQKEPMRRTVSYGGYQPTIENDPDINLEGWRRGDFVVERVNETQMRVVGFKDKTGKVIPVVGIKFESKDLRPEQLPTVVPDAKNKG